MKNHTKFLAQGALLCAMYVALTYLQNFLLPGSTSMAIQMRISEALNIFAFFTPAGIPGMILGCLLFNLSYSQALPLDFLIGTLATAFSTLSMWKLKNVKLFGIPFLGLLMPALWNGLLVGWELTVYLAPEGFTLPVFGLNALYVFLGEAIVMLVCGTILYKVMVSRKLDQKLFAN